MLSDMGMMINRRRVMGKKGLLPSGYTQVEYIENTSTAYIDTRVFPTIRDDMTIILSTTGFDGSFLCGARYNSFGMYNSFFVYSYVKSASDSVSFAYDIDGNGTYVSSGINVQDGDIHTIRQSYQGGWVDGVLKVSYTQRYVSGRTNYIFTINDGGSLRSFSHCKLYKFTYKQNDILVRDMYPCINPNNVVGMYDLVEGKFYSSPNGVAFVAGPVV